MADVLVVKVNLFCGNKDLCQIHDNIINQMKTGVVILPAYCEAQVVPDNIEVRVEDLTGKKGE